MILFWGLKNYYPPFRNQKTAVLNRLSLIGLGLGVLALMDEICAVLHIPVRNVEMHWKLPYWFLFRTISIIGLLVAILFFITAKRSGKAIRTIAGIFFLWMPALVHPFESWMIQLQYGLSIPIVYHLLGFSKETWWISLLLVAVISGGAYYFREKSF